MFRLPNVSVEDKQLVLIVVVVVLYITVHSRQMFRHKHWSMDLMISPTRSSTSPFPLSPTAFLAYSTVMRNMAKMASETCVCWEPCAEPCDRAERRGPETLGADMEGADCEKGVAHSPRTRHSRISKILSVSVICVLRKCWRSFGTPTGELELTAQSSNTVHMVGGYINAG